MMQCPLSPTPRLEQQTKQMLALEVHATFYQSELLLLLQQIEIIKNTNSSTRVDH